MRTAHAITPSYSANRRAEASKREARLLVGLAVALDGCVEFALNADVLVPELGPACDELAHQARALGVIDNNELHSSGANVVLRTAERPILADHDARYTI